MPFRAAALYSVVLSALLAAACAAIEKSENVLSPTVAGPIPGVSIDMPVPLDPKDGRAIEVANQPVTLLIQNAATNGQRPLNYVFEVATDTSFNNKIFVRENIAPGEGGRTSLRLTDALATGRTYFWRARAQDGANTGLYSGFAHFSIFTPIVIGQPIPRSPVNNFLLDSLGAIFVIDNAPRSGPVGPMSYILELADSPTFGNKLYIWTFGEQGSPSRFNAPSPLPDNKQIYWRARAYDTNNNGGDWSTTAVFRTPAVAAPPPPPPGGSCASQGTPLAILQCRRNQYGSTMSVANLNSFLRNSARDFNAAGVPEGPFGILKKDSGSNCLGFSCDILCSGQGNSQKQWDVLQDAEPDHGPSIPVWGGAMTVPGIRVDDCQVQ